MLGQKPEHTPRRQQLASDRLHIPQITLILRPTLHTTSLTDPTTTRRRRAIIQRSPRRRR